MLARLEEAVEKLLARMERAMKEALLSGKATEFVGEDKLDRLWPPELRGWMSEDGK
jgi:hypothetical protein